MNIEHIVKGMMAQMERVEDLNEDASRGDATGVLLSWHEAQKVIAYIERSKTLLEASREILRKSEESTVVVSATELTAFYDEAECDGYCLKDDINSFLEYDH